MNAKIDELIHLSVNEMFDFAQKHADFSGENCKDDGKCLFSIFGINGETGNSFILHVEGDDSIDALVTVYDKLPAGSNCSVYPGKLPLNVRIVQS